MRENTLDISWSAIIKILIAIFVLYVLYLVREIVVWFVFALIISLLFNPIIDFLHKRRIPRVLSVVFVYVAIFGLLALFIYYVATVFISEIRAFSQSFPKYFGQISPILSQVGIQAFSNTQTFVTIIQSTVEQISSNVFSTLFVVFGGLFSTLFIISVAFFLSMEVNSIEKTLLVIFPGEYEERILSLWRRAERRVTGWFFTRIIASLFVGILSYITFLLFDVRYPITLALVAGLSNFVPIVGPLTTAFLLLVVIGLDSPVMAFVVLAAFTLIQQVESNILTPAITKKMVDISPALVLLALAVGGKLWGALGAILVVPMIGMIAEFLHDFLRRQRADTR